jgi:hypothetical protein
VPTLVVQAATMSSAGAVLVAGFEIDGNTPDGAEAGIDWSSLPDATTHTTDPVGNVDTTTFKGSKEFAHPSTWERGTGLAPNQDDISDVYFHDAIVNDEIWGYLGFRRYTTSGVTNFDVEFNKLPNAAANTYMPIRSVGDVMVRFEQDGNKAFMLTNAWFWRRVTSPAWEAGCIQVPGYTPASGWCPETTANVAFTGVTGEDGHFGEGAFNFTTLLEAGGVGDITCEGGDFGTMNIRSFTGNANESALKDYINPVSIDIGDTCGALEIYKVDQFGSSVSGATFSISPNPIPGESASPLVIVEGGAGDPDGQADGAIVIDPATPGSYTVVETAAPAGYELVQPASARTWQITIGEGGTGSIGTPLTVTDRLFFDAPSIKNKPAASYDTDYNWLVQKSVVPHDAEVSQGETAGFDYTVALTALAPTNSGHELGGLVTASNPNDQAMEVTLAITGPGCTYDDDPALDQEPEPGFQVDLAPGANEYAYTCVPGANPANGSTTATMTWDADDYPQDVANPSYTRSDESAYTYELDGVVDFQTTVTDTFNGGAPEDLGTFDWDDVWASNSPAPHTITVKTYSRELGGAAGSCTNYPNTARESADGTSDSETVTVCVEAPLTAAVTAGGSVARAYAWSIAKVADATTRTVDASGTATFHYTVTARAGAMTESGWALGGNVTVTNPNTYAGGAITADVTVATTLGGGSSCTVTGGNDVVVPPSGGGTGQVTLPYTCSFTSAPAGSGTVSTTVTWDPAGEASSASVGGSAPGSFTVGAETNKTVAVVDDKTVPGQRIVLDPSLTWASGLVKTYTYDLAVAGGAAGACAAYTNTAKVDQPTGTDPSASATVQACTPEVLPEQAFGKAVGSVKASCQGTVKARLDNRSGETVIYKLRVGHKVHKIAVKSLSRKKYVTTGHALAKVTLKVGTTRLDRTRIPQRCEAPEVLPDTGLRATSF